MWVSKRILHKFFLLFRSVNREIPSAGADTTASAIGTFFLAMVCYPEVQKEAQSELDKVLNGRLPEHNDIASLPYLSALVKEVYRYAAVSFKNLFLHAKCISPRWQPVAPLGRRSIFPSSIVTSRCLYLVKASRISRPPTISTTTIISLLTLLWLPTNGDSHFPLLNLELSQIFTPLLHRAMLNDEQDYPEPREFRPERFLKNGKLDSSVRNPMDIAFGFGRR
jgi:Cytochrome P450